MQRITETFVQKSVIRYLKKDDWSSNLQSRSLREHDVDIKVKHKKYGRYWLIEAKGDPGEKVKSQGGSRSSSFNSAVGQIITRMHTSRKRGYKYGYKYGIAFPVSFKKKVIDNLPFDVCDKLNLYVFFVDSLGQVDVYDHKKLKNVQNMGEQKLKSSTTPQYGILQFRGIAG